MKRLATKKLLAIAGVLFVLQFALCMVPNVGAVDRWGKSYGPARNGQMMAKGLSPDQVIVELLGFREFLAGILWVRADSFFDDGNYDAVLPLIRLCTILDPHQLDIYSTGMWHIAYNFTDSEERSDRRYVPVALALGKEGCANNDHSYEIFFETGWIWFHKIDDNYDKAVHYFEEATHRDDILPARRNILAAAYFKNNQVLTALDYYYKLEDEANKAFADAHGGDLNARGGSSEAQTIEGNIDNTIVRMVQRGWLAKQKGYYDQGDYDTKPPFDVGFSVKTTVEQAKVLRFQGTYNVLPVGTRIRVVLRDEDFPNAKPAEMDWDAQTEVTFDPSKDYTFMQDQLFVRNRHFDKRVDLSKDPTMYPFHGKNYVVEFYYNPRSAPPHIQDKFGWNGEGMTDKFFMNDQVRPGQRVLYAVLHLTRDQIRRENDWVEKTPTVETPNYKEKTGNLEDTIINVPLRSK